MCQAREQNPFLARFVGDWATKEIVKQFLKNECRNHYRNGWLDVPEKYGYLKNNASKRNPTASRRKKAFSSIAAKTISYGPENSKGKERVLEDDQDDQSEGSEEDVDEDNQ
jgi:hypothetical protein